MKRVSVREILNFEPIELVKGLKSGRMVEFEDGEIVKMTSKEIQYNRFLWEVVKYIPDFKIKSDSVANNFYKNGYLNKSTPNDVYSLLYKQFVLETPSFNNGNIPQNIFTFCRNILKSVNSIYNDLAFNTLEYSVPLDILDLLDVQNNPELVVAMERCEKELSDEAIANAYEVLVNILNSPKYDYNPVAIAFRAGFINRKQLMQVLGPRGKPADLDNRIFTIPIARSFTRGLTSPYHLATESRTCAIALAVTDNSIKEAEYLARSFQFAAMTINRLTYTDCNSTYYMNWMVLSTKMLKNMIGKYYLDEETNDLKFIKGDEEHLVGKTIKLRAVSRCNTGDARVICAKCFGQLAYTLSPNSNLGHEAITYFTRDATQGILSIKHHFETAIAAAMALTKNAQKYFLVYKNRGISLRQDLKHNIKLKISSKGFFGLTVIENTDIVAQLEPSTVSKITEMAVITEAEGKIYEEFVEFKDPCILQTRFLDYVITPNRDGSKKYTLDKEGNIIIDMAKWTGKKEFMYSPQMEYSFFDLLNKIKTFIKTSKPGYADSTLVQLFELVNQKLNVPLSLLEILISALTVDNPYGDNMKMVKNFDGTAMNCSITDKNIGISLGSAYGYERHKNILTPKYFSKKVQGHPTDAVLMPDRYINRFYSRPVRNLDETPLF